MNLTIIGDRAVMQGWFARAVSLLAAEGPCPETGWVALNRGMFESDRQTKERHYREALAYTRESGDPSRSPGQSGYRTARRAAHLR